MTATARARALLDAAHVNVLPSGGAEVPSAEVVIGPVTIRVRGDGTIASVAVCAEAPRTVATGSGSLREVGR